MEQPSLIFAIGRLEGRFEGLEATMLENRRATYDTANALHLRIDATRREMHGHVSREVARMERRLDRRGQGKPLWVHVSLIVAMVGTSLIGLLKPASLPVALEILRKVANAVL